MVDSNHYVRLDFIGNSFLEDWADILNLLQVAAIVIVGTLFIDGADSHLLYWEALATAIISALFLLRVLRIRRHYKDCWIEFSSYPLQREKDFTCRIIVPGKVEFQTLNVFFERSGFDGALLNSIETYWNTFYVPKVTYDKDTTIVEFEGNIPVAAETQQNYHPRSYHERYEFFDGKWKIFLRGKRKDGIGFPRRRYVEVWD